MRVPMNPLVSDQLVDFLLGEVLDVEGLCRLPAFSSHSKETIGPWLAACRRIAREVLFPTYRATNLEAPRFEDGKVFVHPKMHDAWKARQIEKAQEINERLMPLHKVLFVETSPGPVKYAAELLGKCSAELRLPLVAPTDATRKQVREAMVHAGLLN